MIVKAHFDGRVMVPDQPIRLPKNRPLVLRVKLSGKRKPVKRESVLDWIVAHRVKDDGLPADFSERLDQYRHGAAEERSQDP